MIEAHVLTKFYDDFLAVDSVSMQVPAGEVLAVLGPNGAGKTTTVRMLTSILSPTSGWARIAGYDVVQQPAMVRSRVGVLTEGDLMRRSEIGTDELRVSPDKDPSAAKERR